MASLGYKIKTSILKGMEAVGSKAASLASNAQSKLSEIELEKQRRELMNVFPMKAMELMQEGVELPEPLTEILKEVEKLDEQLVVLRAERYANVEGKKEADQPVAEEESSDNREETPGEEVPTEEVPAEEAVAGEESAELPAEEAEVSEEQPEKVLPAEEE